MRRHRQKGAERLDAREAHAERRRQEPVADGYYRRDGDPRRDEDGRVAHADEGAHRLARIRGTGRRHPRGK